MWIFPHQQAEKSLQNQHVLSILQVGSHQLQYRFFRTKKPKSHHKTNTFCPITPYFYQHPAQELLGVSIQLHEEVRRNPETKQFEIAIKLDSWQPIIFDLEPQLRATYANPLDLPEGASERFLIPLD